MAEGVFARITNGLTRSRDKFKESMNVLLDRGPDLDEGFWEELEDALVLSDVGGGASFEIVENLREQAKRKALPDSYAVLDLLSDEIVSAFAPGGDDIFDGSAATVLFVGINGTGKTTTVGKIANEYKKAGRKVILGSADTFRAAAIEQLQVWSERAGVEMVTRERGSDPASVCYETIERAEAEGDDLVLIDTAGRLHTSDDLMRELEKVVKVVRKRSTIPVHVVLVIDATTGQNGLQQAREFNKALDLDALIITKLDGTAKGGIALAISHELGLPIVKIGVGEGIDDLRDFDARSFVAALIGDFEQSDLEEDDRIDKVADPLADDALDSRDDEVDTGIAPQDETIRDGIDEDDIDTIADETDRAEDDTSRDAADEDALSDDVDRAAPTEQTGEAPKMSWAEFVELDDKMKEERPKKHFWEKW